MRAIGMDIHRSFAQVSILDSGQVIKELKLERERLLQFAKTLTQDDKVFIEVTGNSAAVERLMRPYVKRVIVANTLRRHIEGLELERAGGPRSFCEWPAQLAGTILTVQHL
jgi:hypothetical protein